MPVSFLVRSLEAGVEDLEGLVTPAFLELKESLDCAPRVEAAGPPDLRFGGILGAGVMGCRR